MTNKFEQQHLGKYVQKLNIHDIFCAVSRKRQDLPLANAITKEYHQLRYNGAPDEEYVKLLKYVVESLLANNQELLQNLLKDKIKW